MKPRSRKRDPGVEVAVAAEPGARVEPLPYRRELRTEQERKHPAHELLVVGEKVVHGLSAITRVRISRLDGTKVDVEGHGLPHALRRLALLIEAEQQSRFLLPEALRWEEPRRRAYWALGDAHRALANNDMLFRVRNVRVPGPPGLPDLLAATDPEVFNRINAAAKGLRDELDFEELTPGDLNGVEDDDADAGAAA